MKKFLNWLKTSHPIAKIIGGFIIIMIGSFELIRRESSAPQTWYVIIALGLILIFSSRLLTLKIFGIELALQKAKENLNNETQRMLVHLVVASIISDALPQQREAAHTFFTSGKPGDKEEISQFNPYNFLELKSQGIIGAHLAIG